MSPFLSKYNFHVEVLLFAILTLSLIGIPYYHIDNPSVCEHSQAPDKHCRGSLIRRRFALPLSFELNQGQTNERVRFLARSEGYVLFLTATEAVMALDNPDCSPKRKGESRLAQPRGR
jgi:hypothetical protein